MTETIRIPEPVYDRVSREAERQDVSRGVVIKEWMEKADECDELKRRMQ